MNNRMRVLLVALSYILGFLIYFVGLIAPLTPSEGAPTIGAVSFFVGVPVALLGVAVFSTQSTTGKLMGCLVLAALIAFSVMLLYPMYKNG